MKKIVMVIIILLVMTFGAFAKKGFDGRPVTNNVKMPTGHTVNKGEFMVGLGSLAFGVTDHVQVGTNVLLYLAQDYNANLKVNFFKSGSTAFAAGLKVHRFDLEADEDGDEVDFTSLSPFAVLSQKVSDNTYLHLSGQISHFRGDEEIEDVFATATSTGSSFSLGIDHNFSYKTKFLAEAGYDFTFDGMRVSGAVLFGWHKFRLKLGMNYFNPKHGGSFITPVVSLWWRFNG